MSLIPILFEIAWKSLLVAGATLLVLRFARDRTAGERSWIAHGGLAVLFALPLAAVLLPAWSPDPATFDATGTAAAPLAVSLDPAPAAGSQPAAEPVAAPAPVTPAALALPSPGTVALWLYLVPLALLGGTMLLAVVRLFALRARAQVMVETPWLAALALAQRRMGFKHGTALLVSDELRSPISWGVMRPIILLNPTAAQASGEAEAIIAHELAHVARLDWAKLLIARAACALLWFNPLVWMLAREAHQLREEAADDAVLMSDVDGADYAALLVNAARHDNQGLLIAAHGVAPGKDSLKRRITRVLDQSLPRRPAGAVWSIGGLVLLGGFAAPLAAFDPLTVCSWTDVQAKASDAVLAPVAALTAAAGVSAPLPTALVLTPQAAASPRAAVAAARQLGRPLTPEELIELKAVGVSRRDLETLQAAGVRNPSVGQATQARAMGVTPEYASAMHRAFPDADFDEIVAARALGIDPEEALNMRRAFPGADLDDMAGAKATGVTAEYAAQMRRALPSVTLDDLTGMRAVGVNADFVREMQRSLGRSVTADQAIEARAVGFVRPGIHARPRVEVRPHAEARAVSRAARAAEREADALEAAIEAEVDPPGHDD
jgi:beta-lactamase regulating signal transducer with metallopeptidase domain